MAKYIELNELQKFCRNYTEVDAIGLILADRTDLLHTTDVVERKKIDKAIEEMQDSKFDGKTVLTYNDAINDCIKILCKLIESKEQIMTEVVKVEDCCNNIGDYDIPTYDAIIIPKGATNGDMLMNAFPNQTIGCDVPITDSNGAKFYRTTINGITDFTADWWNALYKVEKER